MKIRRTKLSRRIQSGLMNGSLRCVQGAIRIFPRACVGFLVEGLFSLVSAFTKNLNDICVRNLRSVYGEPQSGNDYKKIARRYLKFVGHSMMDLLYYVERPQQLARIVRLEGEEHLQKALHEGRGVIAVSAHLSNFPLMFVTLVQRGYKVNVIIRTMRDENFSRFMYDLCAAWGINMIRTSPRKPFFKESLAALKRNELLFILLDEVVAKEDGVAVPFFNREVTRATGPMLFFKRTGAPILPIVIAQNEQKHYRIFIEPHFTVDERGSDDESAVRNIAGLTAILEGFIRRYPMQWGGWLNKRWASQ